MSSIGLFLVIVPVVFCFDPCLNHAEIAEPRRSADYFIKDTGYEQMICDRILPPNNFNNWFSFKNANTLTKTCTQPYHCGTHIPLWMNGTDPMVNDGVVARQICGADPAGTDCCYFKDTIQVKNCGAYIVYQLVPAKACSFAYCAGTGSPCPPDKWSHSGYEPCADMYPKMLQNPTLSNPIVKQDTFEFNCHINFDQGRTDVGFVVEWVVDNRTTVSTAKVTGATRDVTLDQKYLVGHLGKTLSCRVKSFFTARPTMLGPSLPSNGYWCGIKLETTCLPKDVCPNPTPCHVDPKLQCTPSLRVDEKEKTPREVRMISTVPIVCDKNNKLSCQIQVDLDNNNHDVTADSCKQTFLPGHWNPQTNQAIVKFQVSAKRDMKNDGDQNLAMHFSISNQNVDAPRLFWGYNLPYLPVHTIDEKTSQCSCIGDPHCKTLDDYLLNQTYMKGNYYDLYKVGEFIMYKSTANDRLFQVEVRTWPCVSVTCICGVAAREGNDIIIIGMCQGNHAGKAYPDVNIIHKGQSSHGAVVYEDKAGHYLIDFLSGAQIKIDTFSYYMNVYVTAPEIDFGETEGLCGTFDKNRDNDLKYPDGHHDPYPDHINIWDNNYKPWQPDNFTESWRINVGDSIFDKKDSIQPESRYDQNISYCNCDSVTKIVDCSIENHKNKPYIPGLCPGCVLVNSSYNSGRKRRATSTLEADSDPPQYFFDYGLSYSPQLRDFPSANGKTHADARKACEDAFNKHTVIQQCISRAHIDYNGLIHMCVEDFKYFDDGSMIRSAIDEAVTTCVHVVLTDVSFYDARGNPPAFITTDRCQNDCSGRGSCVHGTCLCNAGFVGAGCEINALKSPKLHNILVSYQDTSLCDVIMRPCETIFLAGDNFHLNSKLKCLLKELKFDGTGFVPTGKTYTTDVQYKNLWHIGCELPTLSQVRGIIIGFNITVTNDGQLFSNQVKVVRTDSTCLNCRDSGDECQIKAGFCVIDAVCREKNDVNAHDSNLQCDPAKSKLAWSSVTSQSAISTPPTAPLGGTTYSRFDIWTTSKTGCACATDASRHDCACCDDGGCQCPSPNQHQCTVCGSTANCGNPQPGPMMGLDGYTLSLTDCPCKFDQSQSTCACCQQSIEACPCGREHRNQCVDCNHMEQCGNKPWIFGPPIPGH